MPLAAETFGLPQVYGEKGYWVTQSLKHLSESVHVDDVVFKGGTSLSKAYRLLHRFLEDIDLAVFKGDNWNGGFQYPVESGCISYACTDNGVEVFPILHKICYLFFISEGEHLLKTAVFVCGY